MSSADNVCKQFGPRSGQTKCQTISGSKLFDTLMVILNFILKKNLILKKKISRQEKNYEKFTSMEKALNKLKLSMTKQNFDHKLRFFLSFSKHPNETIPTRIVRESDYSPAAVPELACSKRPECLRILSGNVILTSIKGNNSPTNVPKMTANNPNVDLVSINSYIKFGQICPFVLKILSRNKILE